MEGKVTETTTERSTPGSMLICGHTDYETHGGELMDELEDNLRRKAG